MMEHVHLWEDTFLWLAEQAATRLAKTKTYNIAITACGKGANWQAALTCFPGNFPCKAAAGCCHLQQRYHCLHTGNQLASVFASLL